MCRAVPLGEASTEQETYMFCKSLSDKFLEHNALAHWMFLRFWDSRRASMCRIVLLGEAGTEQETHMFYKSFSNKCLEQNALARWMFLNLFLRSEKFQHVSRCAIGGRHLPTKRIYVSQELF